MKARVKDLELEFWLRQRNSGELQWQTRNGAIPVKDMSDDHLLAALKIAWEIEERKDSGLAHEACMETIDGRRDW